MAIEVLLIGLAIALGAVSSGYLILALIRSRPRVQRIRILPADEELDMLMRSLLKAERSIHIMGGELALFSNAEVADAIVRKLRNDKRMVVQIQGGRVISAMGQPRHETYEQWLGNREEFGDRFEMRFAVHHPARHYVVIDDGKMVIAEEPHRPNEWPKKAQVWEGGYFTGQRFARHFAAQWEGAQRVQEPEVELLGDPGGRVPPDT